MYLPERIDNKPLFVVWHTISRPGSVLITV